MNFNIPRKIIYLILIGWLLIFSLSSLYCYSHGTFDKQSDPDLFFSIKWSFEILSFWLVLIPLSYQFCNMIFCIKNKFHQTIYLVLFGLFFCTLAFLVQLFIWRPITIEEIPYISYMLLPKFIVAYVLLVFLWYSLKHIQLKTSETIDPPLKQNKKIMVLNGKNETLININEIFYLSSAGNYVEIQCEYHSYLKRTTMKAVFETMKQNGFLRVHRKYIVNSNFIKSITQSEKNNLQITLSNDLNIPIGRQYKPSIKHLNFI